MPLTSANGKGGGGKIRLTRAFGYRHHIRNMALTWKV
jgi:hypothetical protein